MRRLAAVLAPLVALGALLAPSVASAGASPLHDRQSPQYEEWQNENGDCLYAAAAGWMAAELGEAPHRTTSI